MAVQHIVQFSSGIASWVVADDLVREIGPENVTLLFTDTLVEDQDNYRFLKDAEEQLGINVTRICEGRTPDQVFRDERFLGNNRVALCSLRLKIEPARRWIEHHHPDPASCVLYVGIDQGEPQRAPAIRDGWAPYQVEFPLLAPGAPALGREEKKALKRQMLERARAAGLEPPRMYDLGFDHANCGGRCVRAGQAHWLHLLQVWPSRYATSEALERDMRATTGKDIAHLRASWNGESHPLTLAQLRRRQDANAAFGELAAGSVAPTSALAGISPFARETLSGPEMQGDPVAAYLLDLPN
jgi:hypothetical protein